MFISIESGLVNGCSILCSQVTLYRQGLSAYDSTPYNQDFSENVLAHTVESRPVRGWLVIEYSTSLHAARPGHGTFHSLQSELVRGYSVLLYTARNCQRMFHFIQLEIVKQRPTLRPFSTCQGFHKDFLQFPLFLEKVFWVFFSSSTGTVPGRHVFPFFLLFLDYDLRAFSLFPIME